LIRVRYTWRVSIVTTGCVMTSVVGRSVGENGIDGWHLLVVSG
jgi:hypothetical protein